ncbi:MAG: flagellar basal body rod protein FlgF [Sinobacterium sp.]|nr:flagellar basal body rod protein FlgF [Sinobacterium sp.]
MDKGIFLAMHSAKQILTMQRVNANNLANANTTGFKSDFVGFMESPTPTHHLETRSYSTPMSLGTHFKSGSLQYTQNPLDVSINGNGFFAVQNANGQVSLSRRGDFTVGAEGFLRNGAGQFVLGESNEPIQLPEFTSVSVGRDGVISILPMGGSAANMIEVDQLKLVSMNVNRLKKNDEGSLDISQFSRGDTLDSDASVVLSSGTLEMSNVNPTEAMVTMIELSRSFEMQLKYFEQADTNSQKSERLMRLE